MATSSAISSNSLTKQFETLTIVESEQKLSMEEQLANSAIECVQQIAKDNLRRLEGCKREPTLLNNGIFYANEYYYALLGILEARKGDVKVCEAIQKRLELLKQRNVFYLGYCGNEKTSFFKMIKDPDALGGFLMNAYVLKDETVQPSDALMALIQSSAQPIFLGCGEICAIAHYKALLDVLGKRKFDVIFGHQSPLPFRLGQNIKSNYECPFFNLLYQRKITVKNPAQKGETVFFQGYANYRWKHFNGEAGSWNTLCLDATPGKEKFIGFGLKPEGATRKEIRALFVSEYNTPAMGLEPFSAELAKRFSQVSRKALEAGEHFKNHKITDKDLKGDQGEPIFVQGLILKKVEQLKNASEAGALKLMQQWKTESVKAHTAQTLSSKLLGR